MMFTVNMTAKCVSVYMRIYIFRTLITQNPEILYAAAKGERVVIAQIARLGNLYTPSL